MNCFFSLKFQRFLVRQKPVLWILLYLTFVYTFAGVFFFEICVGLKFFRDPSIYQDCSFFFKVLFKLASILACYNTLSFIAFFYFYSKKFSKALIYDMLLSFLWTGMGFSYLFLSYFYDAMFFVWGGEAMIIAIEEYKKQVLALSPIQSKGDGSEQTKYQKALELAQRGVTLLKKRREDGRTFEMKSVRNTNDFTFDEGSNSQSFVDTSVDGIKRTIYVATPCFGAEKAKGIVCGDYKIVAETPVAVTEPFENNCQLSCIDGLKCAGLGFVKFLGCASDWTPHIVSLVISRPSTPGAPGTPQFKEEDSKLTGDVFDSTEEETFGFSPTVDNPVPGLSLWPFGRIKSSSTQAVSGEEIVPLLGEREDSVDGPISPGISPGQGAINNSSLLLFQKKDH